MKYKIKHTYLYYLFDGNGVTFVDLKGYEVETISYFLKKHICKVAILGKTYTFDIDYSNLELIRKEVNSHMPSWF